MNPPELIIYLLTFVFWMICVVGGVGLSILGFFLSLMRGSFGQEEQNAKDMELLRSKKKSITNSYNNKLFIQLPYV